MLRFYGDLAELAWDADRSGEATVPVERPRSVKDAVESCGVPHTEVDLLIVDGRSVGFDHLVGPGDRVAVYPVFASLDVGRQSLVRPPPLPASRFVLDVHLGRLAELLRLLGFDSRYSNEARDDELVTWALDDDRWLLTRDRGLLMRRAVTHGYLVRADDPREQLVEVAGRFGLAEAAEPLARCARCNGVLEPVAKAEVLDRLQPGTRRDHEAFRRCTTCDRLYWRGSHEEGLSRILESVLPCPPASPDGTGRR